MMMSGQKWIYINTLFVADYVLLLEMNDDQ